MKLRQLQFAVEVSRLGSFSQASDRCNATQPTLSTAIAQLEKELGAKIFSRTTRTVELTPFGQHILPYLEAVLTARQEVEAATRAYLEPDQKILRIGISPLVDMQLITMAIEPFRLSHPDVQVFYKECLLDDLSSRIEAGAIDLAVLPRDVAPEAAENCLFYCDALHYLPSGGAAKFPMGPMRVSDIPHDPIIMTAGGCGLNRSLDVLFRDEKVTPDTYPGYAISYAVIQEWIWLGLGAGILPSAKISDASAPSHPLIRRDGRPAEFEFHWIWSVAAPPIAHVRDALDHIRAVGPRLVAGAQRSEAR